MQSKASRASLIVAALAVAVVAFVVLQPSDDEGETASPAPTTEPAAGHGEDQGDGDRKQDGAGGGSAPGVTEIEVEGGSPAGGVADISVERGDEVALLVRTDVDDEVHVHGYDEFADVAPGKPARLSFPASLEGIFDIELEGSHTLIARLEVTP